MSSFAELMMVLGPIVDPLETSRCPPGYGYKVEGGVATGCVSNAQLQAIAENISGGGGVFEEFGTALKTVAPLTNLLVPGASGLLSTFGEALDFDPIPVPKMPLVPLLPEPVAEVPMFEDLELGGLFDSALSGLGSIFDTATDFIADSGAASYFMPVTASLATQFLPQPTSTPMAVPVAAKMPAIVGGAAGAAAAVSKRFFTKFPNLAVAIQKLKNAGHTVSRSKLYGMLKRFGPEFLVSAGILTAAAVSELAVAGPGHRRMNPANSKALRRAARRIKGFHRLCGHVDLLKSRGRRHAAPRYMPCGTCRKSPCRCN